MPAAGIPRVPAEVIKRAIAVRVADMHVMLPGQVVSYDGQLAAIDCMVKNPVFDDDGAIDVYEDLGTFVGVPVCWPRFGGFYLSGPLAQGDEGMLIFASTAIGEWRASGGKSEPVDASRHSLGWPVFFPALFNDSRPLPDSAARASGVVLGKEGSSEQLLIQSGLIQAGASDAQALPTKADYDALISALNTFAGGTVPSLGSTLSTAVAFQLAINTGAAKPVYTTLFKAK